VLRAYARSLIRLDRPAEAADLLTRWSAVGELPRELKILWIDALGRAGRFEEAERRLAAFGPAVEEDAQLLSLRALLSARQGRTEAALSDARKAQQLATLGDSAATDFSSIVHSYARINTIVRDLTPMPSPVNA
jgi:Flp pilus assembly protein TadD